MVRKFIGISSREVESSAGFPDENPKMGNLAGAQIEFNDDFAGH